MKQLRQQYVTITPLVLKSMVIINEKIIKKNDTDIDMRQLRRQYVINHGYTSFVDINEKILKNNDTDSDMRQLRLQYVISHSHSS